MKYSSKFSFAKHLCAGIVFATMLVDASAEGTPQQNEELRKFTDLYGLIRSDYVTEVDDTKLFNGCYNGMMKSLDDRSAYLDKDSFKDLRGRYGEVSIGVMLNFKAGLPYIIGVLEQTPASAAGLQAKDYILSIDGESTEDMELPQVAAKLRGVPSTSVHLTVRRHGEIEERTFTLTREVIKKAPIQTDIPRTDIAYIRLHSLEESTVRETIAAYQKLKRMNKKPFKGLVLDLRDSPGGTLPTALELAAMFIQRDVTAASSKGRVIGANMTYYADQRSFITSRVNNVRSWPEEFASIPMAVLVNENTAAGAEILTGALQDNGRAKVIGRRTFGQGSVQTIRQLTKDTAVKLTTAYFSTPAGKPIQGVGIQPDQVISKQDESTQKDIWIGSAITALTIAKLR